MELWRRHSMLHKKLVQKDYPQYTDTLKDLPLDK